MISISCVVSLYDIMCPMTLSAILNVLRLFLLSDLNSDVELFSLASFTLFSTIPDRKRINDAVVRSSDKFSAGRCQINILGAKFVK